MWECPEAYEFMVANGVKGSVDVGQGVKVDGEKKEVRLESVKRGLF